MTWVYLLNLNFSISLSKSFHWLSQSWLQYCDHSNAPIYIFEKFYNFNNRLYYYVFLWLQQHLDFNKAPHFLESTRSQEYFGYIIWLFSLYGPPNAFPLSLFISLFILSLGERTIGMTGGQNWPATRSGYPSSWTRRGGLWSLPAMRCFILGSTRLYLDETTLRELKSRELSMAQRTGFLYQSIVSGCATVGARARTRKTVGEILFRQTIVLTFACLFAWSTYRTEPSFFAFARVNNRSLLTLRNHPSLRRVCLTFKRLINNNNGSRFPAIEHIFYSRLV